MGNSEKNKKFLSVVDGQVKSAIYKNIAKKYGITVGDVEAELFDAEAEDLLDYVTGPERAATQALMQRHGCM